MHSYQSKNRSNWPDHFSIFKAPPDETFSTFWDFCSIVKVITTTHGAKLVCASAFSQKTLKSYQDVATQNINRSNERTNERQSQQEQHHNTQQDNVLQLAKHAYVALSITTQQ